MRIVKIILGLYATVVFLTLYALIACTTGTPQPFPWWFGYGLYISIGGFAVSVLLASLYLIYWLKPGKRLGVIKGERLCKRLRDRK